MFLQENLLNGNNFFIHNFASLFTIYVRVRFFVSDVFYNIFVRTSICDIFWVRHYEFTYVYLIVIYIWVRHYLLVVSYNIYPHASFYAYIWNMQRYKYFRWPLRLGLYPLVVHLEDVHPSSIFFSMFISHLTLSNI